MDVPVALNSGLSEQAMRVPPGYESFQYAELMIQLPGDWPLDLESLRDPRSRWPFDWLRTIARYPHEHQTWLGGPATIFANGDPPQPIAPGVPFTSFLLMAQEQQIACLDARTIRIYQLTPLYTEERALELAEGIPALLNALDHANIPMAVDLHRPNAGLSN